MMILWFLCANVSYTSSVVTDTGLRSLDDTMVRKCWYMNSRLEWYVSNCHAFLEIIMLPYDRFVADEHV